MSTRPLAATPRRCLLAWNVGLVAVAVGSTLAHAAWQTDGTPLVVLPTSQESPAITPDGSSGAIVVWRDSRNGSTSDIYGQRIDASGAISWSPDGLPICAATGTQSSPDVLADGSSGAIVAWRDDRNGTGDVYAQRIDALGQPLWLGNGIPLAASPGNELFPTIISDLSPGIVTLPGFIVGYFDRTIGQPPVLRVQHVDISGSGLWASAASGGVVVTASTGQKGSYSITTDGVGAVQAAKGCVLAWDEMHDSLTWQDLYVNRVNAAGAVQWGSSGTMICGLPSLQTNPCVANVGGDKVVVAWEDTRNGNTDLYAQKLDAACATLWGSDGVPIVIASGGDVTPKVLPDGAGGALVFWRRGARVYGQRLNPSGQAQWDSTGVPVASIDGAVELSDVAPDGIGGAIVSWVDARSGTNDVYAQRVSPAGACHWNPAGVVLCAAAGEQTATGLAGDGTGGVVAAWRDARSGNFDVYANRVAGGGGVVDAPELPNAQEWRVALASENPTRGGARFVIRLERAGSLAMDVLDVAGRRVRTITTGTRANAGTHALAWDGADASGRPVAAGTYFVRTIALGETQATRIVVVH